MNIPISDFEHCYIEVVHYIAMLCSLLCCSIYCSIYTDLPWNHRLYLTYLMYIVNLFHTNLISLNLYFRDDESAATQIYLPASHPFYLLRYTSTCQSVYYMFVSEETIEWDCQDDSIGFAGFVHPFEDGSENNIKLHFCYYYI